MIKALNGKIIIRSSRLKKIGIASKVFFRPLKNIEMCLRASKSFNPTMNFTLNDIVNKS